IFVPLSLTHANETLVLNLIECRELSIFDPQLYHATLDHFAILSIIICYKKEIGRILAYLDISPLFSTFQHFPFTLVLEELGRASLLGQILCIIHIELLNSMSYMFLSIEIKNIININRDSIFDMSSLMIAVMTSLVGCAYGDIGSILQLKVSLVYMLPSSKFWDKEVLEKTIFQEMGLRLAGYIVDLAQVVAFSGSSLTLLGKHTNLVLNFKDHYIPKIQMMEPAG
ncbi:hypothetical protein ACJX0J_030586, partial [Zea mays]